MNQEKAESTKTKKGLPPKSEPQAQTNAVAERPAGQVSTHVETSGANILSSDILLSRILLMQGLSPLVSEKRKFQIGDIVRSIVEEKIGDDKNPIKFIPLRFDNFWVVKEAKKQGQKQKFVRLEVRNAKNETLEWDFQEGGKDMQRVKALNVLALLESDVERAAAPLAEGALPDLNKTLLPVMISFQSTSYKAGQSVVTHFAAARKNNVEPHKYGLTLSCYQDKNDQGVFMVWKVGPSYAAPATAVKEATEWVQELRARGTVNVDMAEDGAGEKEAVAVPVNNVF